MFGENFKRKYALTHQGVQNVKKGTFWTVIVNIVVMGWYKYIIFAHESPCFSFNKKSS